MDRPKMIISIAAKGREEDMARALDTAGCHINLHLAGMGTARKVLAEQLGLRDLHRDVLLSLCPGARVLEAMAALREAMGAQHHFAAAIPLNCIGKSAYRLLVGEGEDNCSPGREIEMDNRFDLIVAIVNRGFSDLAMDAARKAGAGGGTILHGRGSGIHEAERFFGVSITPEKELVLILTVTEERHKLMAAISEGAGLSTQGKGLCFSLPVDEVSGVVHLLEKIKKDGA